ARDGWRRVLYVHTLDLYRPGGERAGCRRILCAATVALAGDGRDRGCWADDRRGFVGAIARHQTRRDRRGLRAFGWSAPVVCLCVVENVQRPSDSRCRVWPLLRSKAAVLVGPVSKL